MTRMSSSAVGALLLGAAACGGQGRVSDTGYVGTWSIGNDRVRSTLSIVRSGKGYDVRPGVRSADGKWEVRCGWDRRCEEIREGAPTHEWRLDVRLDPASGRLVVEADARAISPGTSGYRTVDEFAVGPLGKTLEANTLERGGQRFAEGARPSRVYVKVSDRVEDPPE